jgi:hypothetical protein
MDARRGLLLLLLVGCRLPDGRTAVEHEQEAARRRDKARAVVRVQETTQPVPSGYEAARDPGVPLAGYAQGRAGHEESVAAKHEQAAQRIRREAQAACLRVPVAMRSSCPVPRASVAEPIERGVRIRPRGTVAAENWRAEIECAQSEARVDRPPDHATCPIVQGTDVRVVDAPGGPILEIVAPTDALADEVRRRAAAWKQSAQ